MLTESQKEKAHKWYRDHYEHVNRLIDAMPDRSATCPPTDATDKESPGSWKPIHWNWFLRLGTGLQNPNQ